jgi:hypothetical protein
VGQLEEITPFQVAYTYFGEIQCANGQRKICFMPIVGDYCKVVYDWALNLTANRAAAWAASEKAKSDVKGV